MASSHDGTCPRNLLQELVTGTSPLVYAGPSSFPLSLTFFADPLPAYPFPVKTC